ncbi:hypothetical protein JCM10213v2_004812 [Rhodosporidiobolus nylandii]
MRQKPYGEEGRSSSSEVELPAGWLKENKAEVVEIVHGDGIPPLESSFSTLHLSDAVVLVVSDSTLLSSKAAQTLLYNLHSKPNLFLALNAPDASSPSSSSPLRTLQHQLSTLFPSTSSSPAVDEQQPQTLLISTSQALAALEALSPSDPTTPPSFESFQKNYVSSQLPTLSSALSAALAPHSSATSSPLQEQTALYLLSTTLHRSAFAGAQIGDSLASASSSLSALAQQADESSLTLLTSLGVDPSSGLLRIPPADLEAAMAALEDTLQTRLAWYKLPYRADDLPAELALVVSQTFLPEFERQLTYSAGAATALQRELSARVDALLASPAWAEPQSAAPAARLASLYSPVMRNRVAQAEVEAQQGATATSLSAALTRRRDQLTAPGGPVEALQRRAQAAVFSSGVLSLSSVVGAAGASVAEYAELATAGGWGLMGVTFAAWLGQNRWEKAKRRFRKDVGERVKGGIEEDLGLAARRLSQRALYKTRTTVALGEELIRQKQDGFEAFRAELAAIEARRKELEAAKKQ